MTKGELRESNKLLDDITNKLLALFDKIPNSDELWSSWCDLRCEIEEEINNEITNVK